MLRVYMGVCMAVGLLIAGCSKHDSRDESVLYGTWVNTSEPKDTLRFMRLDNQNIMQIIQTSGTTPFSELVYTYVEGKLGLVLVGANQLYKTVDSFTWTQQNQAFDIDGYQLYPLLPTVNRLTYVRVSE